MNRRRCSWILACLCFGSYLVRGVESRAEELDADRSFRRFVTELMPVFESRQCRECHSGNGVASDTDLRFPEDTNDESRVIAFGLSLRRFINDESPDESALLQMPTNRTEHSGGERIKRGSRDEASLRSWVEYLANMSDQHREAANELLESVKQLESQPLTIRRLTHSQYDNTIRDLLGDHSRPASRFPKEDFVNGFTNQVAAQSMSPLQSEAYSIAAERLAKSAFRGGDHLGLMLVDQAVSGSEPARQFIQSFGRRAFRRPLDDAEVEAYLRLLREEQQRTGSRLTGAQLVVEAMLQSPHFLFRIESHEDPMLADFATASRLSYFLWDTMPDDRLLGLAESGKLRTREQIESQARRMMDDTRAHEALHEFLRQWLRLDRVLSAIRDRRAFRGLYNSETAAAMVEETTRFFDHLVWQDQNFMDFFTADYTFPNAELARLYEMDVPDVDFTLVSYPGGSRRSGILGQGSLLVLTSKPRETSPTARGLFVRNKFLGHEVPPPPPGTNTQLPEATPENPMTNRQRLEVHLNSEACSNCHRLIDPIGYGLEEFDAIGRFQDKVVIRTGGRGESRERGENGVTLPIDTSAYIQGMPNSDFSSARELGQILASSETCQRCITKQMFRYTFGRTETEADAPVIESALASFRDSGFRFRELVLAMVTSDLFLNQEAGIHEESQ